LIKVQRMTKHSDYDSELLAHCPDLNEWPDRWSYGPEDIPYGEAILEIFKPFLLYLVRRDVGRRTIQKHIDNTWLLGGEIISYVQRDEELRDRPAREMILNSVNEEGGPPSRHIDSESAQASFDSTCRMLYRYLRNTAAK
jgi:hypothetical protein